MRTLTKTDRDRLTPKEAVELLHAGNARFQNNLRYNRNLLQQVNDTRSGQSPFAVVLSCMDSRTSSELIFDQGLGDIFSIRVAGNIVNPEIIGSAEFGCKVMGAKIIAVVGHSGCGAVYGAHDDVKLGHLPSVTNKIRRCIPQHDAKYEALDKDQKLAYLTKANVGAAIDDLLEQSPILAELAVSGAIGLVGCHYDLTTGAVSFDPMISGEIYAAKNRSEPVSRVHPSP
jgi:carbonic anhydrase